jgi:hypothetical protein
MIRSSGKIGNPFQPFLSSAWQPDRIHPKSGLAHRINLFADILLSQSTSVHSIIKPSGSAINRHRLILSAFSSLTEPAASTVPMRLFSGGLESEIRGKMFPDPDFASDSGEELVHAPPGAFQLSLGRECPGGFHFDGEIELLPRFVPADRLSGFAVDVDFHVLR